MNSTEASMLQSLLLALVALVGTGFVVYGAARLGCALGVRRWQPTRAVVIERRVIAEPVFVEQFLTAYYPQVRFRHETQTGTRESGRYSVACKDYHSFNRLDVDQELLPYPAGASVTAFVCPADAGRAVLRRTVSSRTMSHYLAVLCSGLLVLAVCVFVVAVSHGAP